MDFFIIQFGNIADALVEVVAQQWPKALAAVGMSAVQLIRKYIQVLNREHRIKALRRDTRDLIEYIKSINSLKQTVDVTGWDEELPQVEKELRQKREALGGLLAPKPPSPPARGVRLHTLLFIPSRPSLWLLHLSFYGCLYLLGLFLIGSSVQEVGTKSLLIVVALFSGIGVWCRSLAIRFEQGKDRPLPVKSSLKRWFLLYRTQGWAGYLFRIIYLGILLSVALGLYGAWLEWSEAGGEVVSMLVGLFSFFLLGLLVRSQAIVFDLAAANPAPKTG